MDFATTVMRNPLYWAHTNEHKKPETLGDHSTLCLRYYEKLCKQKGLAVIIRNIIRQCGCDEQESEAIYQFFVDAVYQHDLGKVNPAYQRKVLGNSAFPKSANSSNHALLSAYIYLTEHLETVSKQNMKKFSYFLISFSYCIARHHGCLKNIDDYKDKITYCIEKNACYDKELDLEKNSIFTTDCGFDKLKKIVVDETAFYVLNKLLFSIITACDYCATAEYMSGIEVDFSTSEDLSRYQQKYYSSSIYQGIKAYQQDHSVFANTINEQRCKIFLEAEQTLRQHPEASLYYLEAPTGSGKTNMSINLFLTLLSKQPQLSNVFYIFPFNTLVEQTAAELGKYFTYGKDMAVVNSLMPIYVEKNHDKDSPEDEASVYEKAALDKILNNYPIVVTSHVNFFNSLFSGGREQGFPLLKLCNSVVVIDEIQSYRNAIWQQIIHFLLKYADLLNIKIIMMSATLPKLDLLLDKHSSDIINLINDPQVYYQNRFFRDRVELDFSLLDTAKIDLSTLLDKVLEYEDKKVLVEFINKNTAREFFNLLCQNTDAYCVEITGDDNSRCRKAIIHEIKTRTSLIVVATQVIEAGVDIDMDVGFKDISLPDAEEQFLGRINRSCLRCGKAYFFNYDDARAIYGQDERLNYSLKNPLIAALLQQKDFTAIYKNILADIRAKGESKTVHNIRTTYTRCLMLKYQEIEKAMQLIEPTYQIFLAYELSDEKQVISGREVWQRYKELCLNKDIGYGQRKVKLSELAELMSYFTYSVYSRGQQSLGCDEEFGGYYYIENGEPFIENGKFNRKAFMNHSKGLFL